MEKTLLLKDVIETGKPQEIKRAMSVKMSLSGYLEKDIAKLLEVSVQFVRKWKGIYLTEGAKGIVLKYKGSKGYLSREERFKVIEYIKQHEQIELEVLVNYIFETYGVEYNSKKSYYDLLHGAGKSWKKAEQWNSHFSQI